MTSSASIGAAAIVEFSRSETFAAAHRLHSRQLSEEENARVFGKCNNENGHGHNYRVEVTLRGAVHAVTGMLFDLSHLKRIMGDVIAMMDHRNLDKDVGYFIQMGIVSTTENVAVFIWKEMATRLDRDRALLHKVTVWETEKNKFVYRGHKEPV